MEQPIYLVDAFTDGPFRGNPAGVCPLDEQVSDEWMQSVAMEMNQAETAFVRPIKGGNWSLRWFTPTVEVDLCGHATLASAHLLWETGRADIAKQLHFQTRSGELICHKNDDYIEMNFPAEPAKKTELEAQIADAIGVKSLWIGQNRMDCIAILENEQQILDFQPDFTKIGRLPCRGLIISARTSNPKYDFISRFFAPQSGVAEDPVTGSAHCCLAPYWCQELKQNALKGYQASRRGGLVGVELIGDRVKLTGKGIIMLEGKIRRFQPE